MRIENKTVIVTGASRGIGEAAARYFAALGAHVVLAARDADRINVIVGELEPQGATVRAQPTDVSDAAQVKALIDGTITETARIDLLVNNAGLIDPIAPKTPLVTKKAVGRFVSPCVCDVFRPP